MKSQFTSFYLDWLGLAFRGWFTPLAGLAGIASLVIPFLPQDALTWLPPSFRVEVIPGLIFGAGCLLVVVIRLALAPYWLYRDEKSAREAAESARLPLLSVGLPEPPVIAAVDLQGSTSQSPTGTRTTITTSWAFDVLALVCTNGGEVTARGCRARLLQAERLLPGGRESLKIVESIDLPWDKVNPEDSLVVDIAPADTRRIWIGAVRSGGQLWLFRDFKRLPFEYQQLVGGPGTYVLLIQIDGDGVPPQQISLRVVAAEGPRPTNGPHRGIVTVEILAQDSPQIDGSQRRQTTAA